MIDKEDSAIAKSNAQQNCDRLIISMPDGLLKKEARLYSRFKKHKGNALNKLKVLYEEMDQIYAHVGKFTACKKSCSSCCHIPISVSEIEIDYIEKTTRNRRNISTEPVTIDKNSPCPLLVNNCCSIYKFRPFVCRSHVALTETSYWCEPIRCDSFEFPQPRFSEIDRSYQLIRQESRSNQFLDIREVFKCKK